MVTQLNFPLKRYGFYQADLWGELLSPLRRLRFHKITKTFVPMAKRVAARHNVFYRGRFKKGSRTFGSKLLYMRLFFTRFYLGLKRHTFRKAYRQAVRSVPPYRRAFVGESPAPFDNFFTNLESRSATVAQRAYLVKSHTTLRQLIAHGKLSFLSGGTPLYSPSAPLLLGQPVHLTNAPKVQLFDFSTAFPNLRKALSRRKGRSRLTFKRSKQSPFINVRRRCRVRVIRSQSVANMQDRLRYTLRGFLYALRPFFLLRKNDYLFRMGNNVRLIDRPDSRYKVAYPFKISTNYL